MNGTICIQRIYKQAGTEQDLLKEFARMAIVDNEALEIFNFEKYTDNLSFKIDNVLYRR